MTAPEMPNVFVIGTASLDILHLQNNTTTHTIGGAGLYTALAAQRAGQTAGLYAPKPQPMPPVLAPADAFLARWTGPAIPLHQLPRLEIAHHGRGKATLLDASWGAEARLTPGAMPSTVGQAKIVHIAALSSAHRQLDFLTALRQSSAQISVGTYARLVQQSPSVVRQLLSQATLFFMNENEAISLFGGVEQAVPGKQGVVFVTLDAAGALVIESNRVTHVPGHPVAETDPTGAGDTFCGATLAGLVDGLSPVEAAERAVILAAQTVAAVGPAALLP